MQWGPTDSSSSSSLPRRLCFSLLCLGPTRLISAPHAGPRALSVSPYPMLHCTLYHLSPLSLSLLSSQLAGHETALLNPPYLSASSRHMLSSSAGSVVGRVPIPTPSFRSRSVVSSSPTWYALSPCDAPPLPKSVDRLCGLAILHASF